MRAIYLHLLCGNRLTMILDEKPEPWTDYDRERWGLQWCVCRECRRRARIVGQRALQQPVVSVRQGPTLVSLRDVIKT